MSCNLAGQENGVVYSRTRRRDEVRVVCTLGEMMQHVSVPEGKVLHRARQQEDMHAIRSDQVRLAKQQTIEAE